MGEEKVGKSSEKGGKVARSRGMVGCIPSGRAQPQRRALAPGTRAMGAVLVGVATGKVVKPSQK